MWVRRYTCGRRMRRIAKLIDLESLTGSAFGAFQFTWFTTTTNAKATHWSGLWFSSSPSPTLKLPLSRIWFDLFFSSPFLSAGPTGTIAQYINVVTQKLSRFEKSFNHIIYFYIFFILKYIFLKIMNNKNWYITILLLIWIYCINC